VQVDVDALERAAAEAQNRSPIFRQLPDMPPPPVSVLPTKRRPSGSYRALTPSRSVTEPQPDAARYSAPRPASIFATTRPSQTGSVFGEDSISGKSLDEVILSFLSEEFGAASEDDKEGKK
jgi:hypothetical protein